MTDLLRRLTLFLTVPIVAVFNLFLLIFPISVPTLAVVYGIGWIISACPWLITGKPYHKRWHKGFSSFIDLMLGTSGNAFSLTIDYVAFVCSKFQPSCQEIDLTRDNI